MFWSKNKKNKYTPAYPRFCYIKVGFNGVYITRTCFPDAVQKFVAGFKRATDEGLLPEIAHYSPYFLHLNVFTASKGSYFYILFLII